MKRAERPVVQAEVRHQPTPEEQIQTLKLKLDEQVSSIAELKQQIFELEQEKQQLTIQISTVNTHLSDSKLLKDNQEFKAKLKKALALYTALKKESTQQQESIGTLEKTIQNLKASIVSLTKQLGMAQEANQQLTQQNSELSTTIQQREQSLASQQGELDGERRKVEQLTQTISSLKSGKASVEDSLGKQIQQLEQELLTERRENEALTSTNFDLNQTLINLEGDKSSLEKRLLEQVRKLQLELSTERVKNKDLTHGNSQLTLSVESLKARMVTLERSLQTQATTHREQLTEKDRQLLEKQKIIDARDERIAALEKYNAQLLQDKQLALRTVDEKVVEAQQLSEQIVTKDELLSQLGSELNTLRLSHKDLVKQLLEETFILEEGALDLLLTPPNKPENAGTELEGRLTPQLPSPLLMSTQSTAHRRNKSQEAAFSDDDFDDLEAELADLKQGEKKIGSRPSSPV